MAETTAVHSLGTKDILADRLHLGHLIMYFLFYYTVYIGDEPVCEKLQICTQCTLDTSTANIILLI